MFPTQHLSNQGLCCRTRETEFVDLHTCMSEYISFSFIPTFPLVCRWAGKKFATTFSSGRNHHYIFPVNFCETQDPEQHLSIADGCYHISCLQFHFLAHRSFTFVLLGCQPTENDRQSMFCTFWAIPTWLRTKIFGHYGPTRPIKAHGSICFGQRPNLFTDQKKMADQLSWFFCSQQLKLGFHLILHIDGLSDCGQPKRLFFIGCIEQVISSTMNCEQLQHAPFEERLPSSYLRSGPLGMSHLPSC